MSARELLRGSVPTEPSGEGANQLVDRAAVKTHSPLWPILLLTVGGLLVTLAAFWPGVMIDDARWQYQQSVDGAYEDWHPPLMAWLWRQLIAVMPGPGPMLLLQLGLAWGGLLLCGLWAWRQGRIRAGLLLIVAGWVPASLTLFGAVTKDCLMAGALLAATGLLLWLGHVAGRGPQWVLRGAVLALLLFAAALRFNAFFACLPLALATLPRTWLRSWTGRILAPIVFGAAFLGIGPVVSAALQAEHTGVQESLLIFDLGGITAYSVTNVFPDLGVKKPVAVNRRCYDPYQWDTYSDWAKVPCPLGYDAIQPLIDDDDLNLRSVWLRAIRDHPLAYAEHRLAHFNQATYLLIRKSPGQSGWLQSADNPWHFKVGQTSLLALVGEIDSLAMKTPLGWPCVWLAAALAVLILSWRTRVHGVALALAASATLYGGAYLLVGVATGMRYQLWTLLAAWLSAVLVGDELSRRGEVVPRRLVLLLSLIVIVPAALALGARTGG